jgi:hypothetical protein
MKNPINKYYAKKVYDEVYGMFDSKKEYAYFQKLLLLQRAGHIHDLKRSIRFDVIEKTDKFGKCTYIADFEYYDKDNIRHVVDAKGRKKGSNYEKFVIKQKLMYSKFGIFVEEV